MSQLAWSGARGDNNAFCHHLKPLVWRKAVFFSPPSLSSPLLLSPLVSFEKRHTNTQVTHSILRVAFPDDAARRLNNVALPVCPYPVEASLPPP